MRARGPTRTLWPHLRREGPYRTLEGFRCGFLFLIPFFGQHRETHPSDVSYPQLTWLVGWLVGWWVGRWLGWVGLGWVGLGWVGLGWVGLGWVGLGWVGLGWVGLVGWLVGWVGQTNHNRLISGSVECGWFGWLAGWLAGWLLAQSGQKKHNRQISMNGSPLKMHFNPYKGLGHLKPLHWSFGCDFVWKCAAPRRLLV